LTVQEMSMLHEHPAESAEIIRSAPAWASIAGWAAAHHERLDGRGYPEGLTIDDIPAEARILAIADIYEALTANRPHRPAMAPKAALGVLRGMAGQNVDPALVKTFESVADEVPAESDPS
jgi:putative two-component system response regulator